MKKSKIVPVIDDAFRTGVAEGYKLGSIRAAIQLLESVTWVSSHPVGIEQSSDTESLIDSAIVVLHTVEKILSPGEDMKVAEMIFQSHQGNERRVNHG